MVQVPRKMLRSTEVPFGAGPTVAGGESSGVRVDVAQGNNPVLPASSEAIYAVLAFAPLVIAAIVIFLVLRQVTNSRRRAERAAVADEQARLPQ